MIYFVRKRAGWLILGTILSGSALFYVAAHAAGVEPKLVNFQGYLTDTGGTALDGTYGLTFRIWDSAVGGTVLWTETHPTATVINGNVSALLGSRVPMTLAFDVGQNRYLGVQVGNDPEMTPRQHLLPSHHSVVSSRLVVNHANGTRSEFGANEIVPIGGVISYFGDPANLPGNWRVCDGSAVDDPLSPLNGHTLPDMTNRFIRGIGSGQAPGHMAGQDTRAYSVPDHTHNYHFSVGNHKHTINGVGDHKHATSTMGNGSGGLFVDPYPPGGLGNDIYTRDVWGFTVLVNQSNVRYHLTSDQGAHTHTMSENGAFSINQNTEQNGAYTSTIDVIPSYVALYYIIRIK
jgi:hypothetical protein